MKTTTPGHRVYRLIFLPVFSGMLTAQAIATVFVYLSNQRIYETTQAIEKAGFLPIPNSQVMVSLNNFGAAFWGGLFYTLSIGTGLTLLTWGALRMWGFFFKHTPRILWGCAAVCAGLLIWLNLDGLVLFPSLFCLAVPAVTGWLTFKGIAKTEQRNPNLWFVPMVTLVLLTAVWATQMNNHLFTTIRDHILLSNPLGSSVNDFYYRYTLYAAEAFKSFNQKTLRTCKLEGFEEEKGRQQMAKKLSRRDVLIIPEILEPDLLMVSANGKVLLTSPRGVAVETTVEKFLADTNGWLDQYSKASDRNRQFRRTTLYGLLIGFPILLFVITYVLLRFSAGLVMGEKRGVLAASSLCLFMGMMLFLPMLRANPVEITEDGMNNALTSDRWPHRVAALRFIDTNKVEIAHHPSYRSLVTSPLVVERYWLARALARSRDPATYGHLLTLLNDSHPNVVCQAFFALGERKKRKAIKPIKRKLMETDHWYAQWYGYRALRRLGWHQGLSR